MTRPYEEGDPTSKICILGEAPARTEVRMGRPLVGPSGQLLDQCLHSVGLIRRECYILNVFEFEVSKSKDGGTVSGPDGPLWTNKNGLTEYGKESSKGCVERLQKSSVNVVVPLGGTALHFLFGDSRVMKYRGSILPSGREGLEGLKLVPTVHPAACLRGNYLWRYLILNDLQRAKEESVSSSLNYTKRHLLVDPTYTEVMATLESLLEQKKTVAVDIEVMNHQVSCIAFAWSPTECICVPFTDEGDRWSEEEEDEIWLAIAKIMAHEEITKIGQNIIFDIGFLLSQNSIFTRGPLADTMVAHHIIWPDFPKGLDFLCSMHTREPYYKDDGKIWKKVSYDIRDFWVYNAKDSATTYEIWLAIQEDLDKGFRQIYDDTIALFPILLYMQLRGMKVDAERLEQTKKDVAKRIVEKEHALEEASEEPFNPTSPKQCQEYFYGTKGIKPYISRSTGRPTTDDKAMSRIYRRFRLPEAKLVQEIRALKKLSGTYLEVGVDRDGRIRCSYNPRGTTTGRLSSSKTIFGTGMNMQNLHPEFKGFLVADDG